MTERLEHRIRVDFGEEAEPVMQLLEEVDSGNQDRERVIAAVVLGSRGELESLFQLVELSAVDWRDVLVGGGLGNAEITLASARRTGQYAPRVTHLGERRCCRQAMVVISLRRCWKRRTRTVVWSRRSAGR
jgi:hypothetical protein